MRQPNRPYTPERWYWVVGDGPADQVFSSAVRDFIPDDDPDFLDWKSSDMVPTIIATQAELQQVLRAALPHVYGPNEISDRQFFQALAMAGEITEAEALEAVGPGVIPAALSQLIDGLPGEQAFAARMLLRGATVFKRDHPMVAVLAQGMAWTNEQLDDLWQTASTL
jgi:hypothetical protein